MALIAVGFQGTLQWILHHGYPLLFLVMLIEGPVVTAAGAFAAALHYFNIWAVLILSILANLIPDLIYYSLGYWGRYGLINKYGHYLGITQERVAFVERLAHKNLATSLLVIKTVPLLATPGLVILGVAKTDIKKYAFWCTIITIPTSVIYLLLGYYFGAAYANIDHYLHIGGYVIAVAIAVVIVFAYFERKYAARIVKKLGDE